MSWGLVLVFEQRGSAVVGGDGAAGDAWQTNIPREWCMVAGMRSNSLRVCSKYLHAAQVAPCMPTLCVATQNVCHRLI